MDPDPAGIEIFCLSGSEIIIQDPDSKPDPDSNPDPKKIVTDPQRCLDHCSFFS